MLQDITKNSQSVEQPEESSCDKVLNEETNIDEQNDFVDGDVETNTNKQNDVVDRDEGSKSCQPRGSKHQAARFANNQRKSKKN